jgi:hypothetical protein
VRFYSFIREMLILNLRQVKDLSLIIQLNGHDRPGIKPQSFAEVVIGQNIQHFVQPCKIHIKFESVIKYLN